MQSILSDSSKFTLITKTDTFKDTIKKEDSINRLLAKLKDSNIISDRQYEELYLQEHHLEYSMVQRKCTSLTSRYDSFLQHTNSYLQTFPSFYYLYWNHSRQIYSPWPIHIRSFHNDITSFRAGNSVFMVANDIKSLYTNIQLQETIELACNAALTNNNAHYNGFTRKQFQQTLLEAMFNTRFLFNYGLYSQIDGLSMGNPAAPHLANIFYATLKAIYDVSMSHRI